MEPINGVEVTEPVGDVVMVTDEHRRLVGGLRLGHGVVLVANQALERTDNDRIKEC